MAQRYLTKRIDRTSTTPAGGLRVEGALTGTGVFKYKFKDGTERRELRAPEEVFHPDSLKSLDQAPVTVDHPPDGVDPSNWKNVSVGHAHRIAPDGDGQHVYGVLDVNDGDTAKRAAPDGDLKELSCGYECGWDPTPGVWTDGQKYDGKQTNIRYNHVALGPTGWGRQGPTVALRHDSAFAIVEDPNGGSKNDTGRKMTDPLPSRHMDKQTIDGIEYTVGTPEHRSAVEKMLKRVDKAETEAATAKADLVTAKADAAKASDPKTINEKIASRVRLIADAKKLYARARLSRDDRKEILAKLDADATTDVTPNGDDAIIISALQSLNPGFDPKGLSHEALMGALQFACANSAADEAEEDDPMGDAGKPPMSPNAPPAWDSKNAPRGRLGEPRVDSKNDADEPDEDKAIEEKKRRDSEAWKPEERVKRGTARGSALKL